MKESLGDEPFSYTKTKDGLVMIYAGGKLAKSLKGKKAEKLLHKLHDSSSREQQLIMAKETGQFKFGNER